MRQCIQSFQIFPVDESKTDELVTKAALMTSRMLGDSIAGPLATIEGVQAPLMPQGTGMSIPKSPPPTSSFPPLTMQDRTKFPKLFQACSPVDGLLSSTFVYSVP